MNGDYVLPTLNEDVKTLARVFKEDMEARHVVQNPIDFNKPECVRYRDVQGVIDNCQTRIDEKKLGLVQTAEDEV